MTFPSEAVHNSSELTSPTAARKRLLRRPPALWSDLWKAPLHDFPIRDEILFQYLPLSADMDVLEIGPGSGFTAFRMARQVRHLTLLDVAPTTIAHLQRTLGAVPNLAFLCNDLCDPGLAGELKIKFDAAYALEVFEYLADPAACLRNLACLLRPGGRLLIQFPNYPPPRASGPTHIATRAELGRLLGSAGFRSWEVFALRLRPHAARLFGAFHEWPLQRYRRWRRSERKSQAVGYDGTWAFQYVDHVRPYKILLHAAWAVLAGAMRVGGGCFQAERLEGQDIFNRNLLVLACR